MELEDGQDPTVRRRNDDINLPVSFSESQNAKDLGHRIQRALAFTFLLQMITFLFKQAAELKLAAERNVYVKICGRPRSGRDRQQEV